jgi:peptide deformylase
VTVTHNSLTITSGAYQVSDQNEIEHALAEAFIAELKRWRDVRGFSQSALAKEVGYTPSYVSKVEAGTQRPSATFSDSADRVLRTGGALRRALADISARAREGGDAGRRRAADRLPSPDLPPGSLIVEHDEAVLTYDGHAYHAFQRRRLHNTSNDPITRYLIRISVDRHPGDPERSNQLYRELPLKWEDLKLTATHEGRNPMHWRVRHDRDAFKEVWLCFENDVGHFPLYPGERAWIEYGYTVSDALWGNWFQRAVRLPTERLSVRLDFPAELQPMVWGMETTMTADALPFRTAIQHQREGDRDLFTWSTDDPPLHARYRMEWRFGRPPASATEPGSPSETMAALGIVQEGDPILRQVARRVDLPAEAEDARRVIAQLHSALGCVETAHTFGKGVGIAAPQVGINRAAALVRAPDHETITLLNPQVIEETPGDEQYEGCLSFFDVRGKVPRPLTLHVEHQDVEGQRRITVFERGVARLVAHEIDHLNGVLYTDRMRPGVEPIPVSEYKGIGQQWRYQSNEST